MYKDRYSYIAIFSYDNDGISIEFPDLPGCLPCAERDNTEQALRNAKEALGLHLYGMEQDGEDIPEPSLPQSVRLEDGQVPVLIETYMPPIRERTRNKFVKKTLSIPTWVNAAAIEAGVNFSQVLQDALIDKLHLA